MMMTIRQDVQFKYWSAERGKEEQLVPEYCVFGAGILPLLHQEEPQSYCYITLVLLTSKPGPDVIQTSSIILAW